MQYDADKKCEEYSLLCLLKQTASYLLVENGYSVTCRQTFCITSMSVQYNS